MDKSYDSWSGKDRKWSDKDDKFLEKTLTGKIISFDYEEIKRLHEHVWVK